MSVANLPETMLACQIVEHNKPHEVRRIPTPKPSELGPHDLLLKVAVSSLCHSDLEYQAGALKNKLPVTASHEGTGVVVARGEAAKHFNLGDRIMAGQTYGRCGRCEDCNGPENYRHYCAHAGSMMSVERDGAFAEYLITDAREACVIPDGLSFVTAAPLACAGVTVWRGILQAEIRPGGWIGIVGSGGGLGHLGIKFAKARGLKVIGVDARDDGLTLSKEAGADVVLDARKGKEQLVVEVMQATGGRGVDGTVNVSDAKSAAATSAAITRMHGIVVQIALVSWRIPRDGRESI